MGKLFKNKLLQILFLATFLRIFLLGVVPLGLNWDEVSMGYTAYSVSTTGRDEWGEKLPLFFRSYGEWKSAVYVYLLIPFIQVMGLNAWSIRLPAALAGIISVYVIYLLGKRLYSERVGLWAAFLMAVTPWTFMLSRPALEANVALALILTGLYCFLKNRYLVSAILFGLAPHTYNSAKIVVPLLVLYLLFSTRLYKKLKSTLLFLGVLALFACPILLNLSSGHSLARFNQVGVATDLKKLDEFISIRQNFPLPDFGDKLLFNKYSFTLYQTASNWLTYLNPAFLVIHGGDHNQHHLPYHGVLYVTQGLLLLVGIYSALHLKSQHRFLPLFIAILGFLPAALTRDSYHVLRSLLAAPGFILLSALGIAHLQESKFKYSKVLYGVLGMEMLLFMLLYFAWYPRAYARDWQYGHEQVAAYLQQHEGEYQNIVMTKWYGEPQLFLAFYNRWEPTWYQAENKENLRYETEGRLWLDQLPEYSLGKYTFKYLNWAGEARTKDTLYVGKPDDFYVDSNVKTTILFPDGSPAFVIVEGEK